MRIPAAKTVQTLLVLGMGLGSACRPKPPQERLPANSAAVAEHPSPVSASLPVDKLSAATRAASWLDIRTPALDSLTPAYQQFARFLELAVATRSDLRGLDSIYYRGSLEDLGLTERDDDMRWLAASHIISVRTSGDSGNAVAVITTVAQQTPENEEGHYAVHFGIRDDTVHWLLVRTADTGRRWKIYGEGWMMGDPRDQFSVLHVGRDLHWVTGSREQAIAAVDSIRRARGLEIVR